MLGAASNRHGGRKRLSQYHLFRKFLCHGWAEFPQIECLPMNGRQRCRLYQGKGGVAKFVEVQVGLNEAY